MDERIFDVSKPHKVNPGATSKPVIVGHHPEMPDPMIRENAPDKPDIPEQPEFGPPTDSNPLGLPEEKPPATEPENLIPDSGTAPAAEPTPEIPPEIEAAEPPAEEKPPPSTDQPPPKPPMFNKATGQTVEPTHSSWKPEHELPISDHHSHGGKSKTPLYVLLAVLGLLGVYALLDSGVIVKVNLPVHLFGQDEPVQTQTTALPPSPVAQQPSDSETFTISGADISFTYPVSWGAPSLTRDPGFSKRGGENKSDGTYAYLVNFASNKDIQIAVTSSQLLPAEREPLYYDFQRWCAGTADGKYYREMLNFTSSGGIDTPTTVACNNGPLSDALKTGDKLIFQAKTKDASGRLIGDVYTLNLDSNDLPVLRVRDAASTNSDEIEKLLASVKT